jgi:hypothetical protein
MTTKLLSERVTIILYGDEVAQFHKLRQYKENGMIKLKDKTNTVKDILFNK